MNLAAESMRTTPAGSKKSEASFRRAKRYVKRQRPLPAQGPLPVKDLLPQRQPIHASPKSQDAVGNFLNDGSFSPNPASQFDIENTLANLGTTLSSPGRVNFIGHDVPRSPSAIDPYDYGLSDETIGLGLDQTFDGNSNLQLVSTRASPNPLFHIPSFAAHDGSLEAAHLNSWPDYPVVDLSVPGNILSLSRFAEFEEYLHSRGVKFTSRDSAEPTRNSSSLSAGFALKFFSDMILSKQQSLTRRASDIEYAFQRLSTLIPGESAAIITQNQAFETKLIRILLFSLLNGFAGLNDIPIESILKFLGRLQIVNRHILTIIKDGPAHSSRTFVDNIFRAAIEAKDERVLKQLLKYQLVDINDTVCFFNKERYTPVERAASLQAFNLVRILVDSGADVNKNHTGDGGALNRLMADICSKDRRSHDITLGYCYWSSPRITATLEMTRTVYLLTEAGTTVTPNNLTFAAANFTRYDIAYDLSLCILPSHHQAFFQGNKKDYMRTPIVEVVLFTDDDCASKIIRNMINLCERDGCGECLTSRAQGVEFAAIEGAKHGLLSVVQLLIYYMPLPTRIFSAAIRSKSRDLIDFVLSHNPELDPVALSLNYENDCIRTTPLAEAVRAGNEDLINRLHDAGALCNLSHGDRFEPLVLAAARSGNMSYMQMLLPRADNSRHPYRPPGVAIHLALQNGHEDIAWLLLENGALVERGYQGFSDRQDQSGFKDESEWSIYSRANPLYLALKYQNTPLIRVILSSDVEEITDEDLDAAVKWEDISIISDLVLACPTIFVTGQSLHSLCMRSMKEDNVNIFQGLLESIQHPGGASSLSLCLRDAVKMDHTEMARYLLDIGVNPFDNTVLKSALPYHPQMLQLLFDKGRERQAVPKCIGAYVLKRIIVESVGDLTALDAVLETRAVNFIALENICHDIYDDVDDNADRIDYGWLTPLGLALVSVSKHRETNPWMVKKLLQAGSDPNRVARSKYNRYAKDAKDRIVTCHTGLMLAIETARQDIVQLLIDYRADFNKKPHFTIKRTPLQYAAELGHLDIVRMLLDHGADVNGEPALRSGGTALQFAASSGNCNIAAELLNHGALLGALPSKVDGRWPLEAAAEQGRFDMIQFLWNIRAKLVGDVAGFERRHCLRAMNFARENGHRGCADLISELSEIPVDRLDVENYGAPWLAYSGQDRLLRKLFRPVDTEPHSRQEEVRYASTLHDKEYLS
jgi:ankyrin repeat protein